jgi:hypothetical protein
MLDKMKNQNTTLSEQFQNQTAKIVERGKIDTPTHKYMTTNTQIHDH